LLYAITLSLGGTELYNEVYNPEQIEYINYLRENPLNINTASLDELQRLPYITPILAKRIIKHRPYKHFEDFISKTKIPEEIWEAILPYITILPTPKSPLPSKGRIVSLCYTTLPKDSITLISQQYRAKAEIESDYYALLFQTEHDPNEPNIVDFYSLSLELKLKPLRIILGDYDIDRGEGLLFSSYHYFVSATENIKHPDRGITKYSTVFENGGVRGASAEIQINTISIFAFTHNTYRDGKQKADTSDYQLYDEGLHVSEQELANKDIINERGIGGGAEWNHPKAKIGATAYYSLWNPPIEHVEDSTLWASVWGNIEDNNRGIFWETSITSTLEYAGIIGTYISTKYTGLRCAFFHYSHNYYSPYGKSLSLFEGQGETGISSVAWIKGRGIKTTYHLAYSTSQQDVEWYSAGNIYTRVFAPAEIDAGFSLHNTRSTSKFVIRYTSRGYKLGIELRSPFPNNTGGLVALNLRFQKGIHKLTAKSSFFSIDGYDSRVYIYEPNLPWKLSIYPVWGTGMRTRLCYTISIGSAKVYASFFYQWKKDTEDRYEFGVMTDVHW